MRYKSASQGGEGSRVPQYSHCSLSSHLHYFNMIFKKIYYLFSVTLGLCCCARAFSSCGEQGLPFVAVRGLLTGVTSLVAEHGL